MLTGHRSAWRRSLPKGRVARIAVPVAIPMALALVLGVIIAESGGGAVTRISQSALGGCASPSAAASAPAAAAAASPCPSTAAVAAASPSAAAAAAMVKVTPSSFANGPIAQQQLGDVATAPVDGQGNAINLNQSAAQAAASTNCTIVVPANPLTAQGLATPYQLADGCSEAISNEQAFVEATILSPNGAVQVYNPLVITQGTTAVAAPAAPTVPRGSQVIIYFGFNGTNLVLTGPGAMQRGSGCVDALGQSLIGQVAACNAVNFFRLANAEIGRGTLTVPPAGTATDGKACETTRDFALIDQDQSDNTYSAYLLNGTGQTAQDTAANAAAMGGSTVLRNGSDNALLGAFVDPANGCKPFAEPDTTAAAGTSGSQVLNELSARVNQQGTIALVPTNNEMTMVGAALNVAKTNVYRSLVDQPLLARNTNATAVAAAYCMNMVNIAPARNQLDMTNDANFASPVPAVGNSLATFLGNRLTMSFANLGCAAFGLTNPATVTLDGNGVATAVTYTTTQQQAMIPAAAANGNGQGRGHAGSAGRKIQNPSHM